MSDAIAGYAKAMFEVAKAEGVLGDVEEELFRFERILANENELAMTLSNPGLPPERRQSIIEELLSGKVVPQTVHLLSFIVGSGKARQLQAIIDSLLEMAAQERNKASAEVRTAVPLTSEQKEKLISALSQATGKTIELRTTVDSSVIGGVWAKIEDEIVDGTVQSRLEHIKENLLRA